MRKHQKLQVHTIHHEQELGHTKFGESCAAHCLLRCKESENRTGSTQATPDIRREKPSCKGVLSNIEGYGEACEDSLLHKRKAWLHGSVLKNKKLPGRIPLATKQAKPDLARLLIANVR